MMKTKKDQVIELIENGDYVGALRIAKSFNRDFNKEDAAIVRRAHEMQNNSRFYEQLGFNKEEQFEKAVEILNKTYL